MKSTTAVNISEKVWRSQVVALAKTFGWEVYFTWTSIHSPAGFPDLVLARDRVIFAELKTEIGRLTDRQTHWLDVLRAAGQECYVWRPSDWETVAQTLR